MPKTYKLSDNNIDHLFIPGGYLLSEAKEWQAEKKRNKSGEHDLNRHMRVSQRTEFVYVWYGWGGHPGGEGGITALAGEIESDEIEESVKYQVDLLKPGERAKLPDIDNRSSYWIYNPEEDVYEILVHFVGYSHGSADAIMFLDDLYNNKEIGPKSKQIKGQPNYRVRVRTITLLDMNEPTVKGWWQNPQPIVGDRTREYWERGFVTLRPKYPSATSFIEKPSYIESDISTKIISPEELAITWATQLRYLEIDESKHEVYLPELSSVDNELGDIGLVEHSLSIRTAYAPGEPEDIFGAGYKILTAEHKYVIPEKLKVTHGGVLFQPSTGVPDQGYVRRAVRAFIQNPNVAPPRFGVLIQE